MLRRVAITTVAAAAVLILPGATFAYTEGPNGLGISDAFPEPGEPFAVTVTAEDGASDITLTVQSADVPDSAIEIAGMASEKKAVVDGTSTFDVTLSAEGEYTANAVDDLGNEYADIVIRVGDPAVAGAGDIKAEATGAELPAKLQETGVDGSTLLAGAAAALMVVGGGTALFARRQRKALEA